MRRPRAARQDCPTEMWSSPVFFCRNGPCGQQKKPRRACGALRGEAAACGPAASGDSDWQEILESNFLGESLRNVMHGPKGQRGGCLGPPAQRQGRRLSGPPRSPPKDKGSAGGPSRRPARTGHPAAPAPPPPPIQTGCNRLLPPLPEAGPRGSPPWRTPPRPAPGC